MATWHVKVNNGRAPDLYAQPPQGSLFEDHGCGCLLARCGFAIANPECQFHGDNHIVKLSAAHLSTNCPEGRK